MAQNDPNKSSTRVSTLLGRLLAILAAILGQVLLNAQHLWGGLGLYAAAVGGWLYSTRALPYPTAVVCSSRDAPGKLSPVQRKLLYLGLQAVCVNVVVTLAKGAFTWTGVVAWAISIVTFAAAFWEKRPSTNGTAGTPPGQAPHIGWWAAAFAALLLLGVFFRAWRLQDIPPEMTLDHTQNLLDVRDIVEAGLRPIFFPRNTGREPLYFYWTALLARLTGRPADFTALKIGTVLAGLLTLPGIYLLATELYGRTVGLAALAFAAVAGWPVILSRLGLRSPFAPLFAAWAFYFLIRGLRRGERHSFVLLGLCLGAGLYGYTAFRVVPVAIGYVWLALKATERAPALRAHLSWRNLGVVVAVAGVVFVPLGVFSIAHGRDFWGRSAWYLLGLPDRTPLIFLDNLKNVLLMFNWRGDMIPLNSLPYVPVLAPVLGGLFVLGMAGALRRATHRTGTLTFVLLLLGFFALLPSTLAINFPDENPSVMRTSCAIPVVLTIAALPVGMWLAPLAEEKPSKLERIIVYSALAVLLVAVIATNATRVFVRYPQTYRDAVANTSEIADVIRCFGDQTGTGAGVYVIAGPGWINDDALAFELGLPEWRNTSATVNIAEGAPLANRLYILHPSNGYGLRALQTRFPDGVSHTYISQYDKNFVLFLTPGTSAQPVSADTNVARLVSCARQAH